VVADTHAALWYLHADPRLSANAKSAMETAIQTGTGVFVSAMSRVELTYLVEKGRLPATALAMDLPLVTRDGKIRAAAIETIW
jgi:PIN domain nuclease of toxin-antitoxin system